MTSSTLEGNLIFSGIPCIETLLFISLPFEDDFISLIISFINTPIFNTLFLNYISSVSSSPLWIPTTQLLILLTITPPEAPL